MLKKLIYLLAGVVLLLVLLCTGGYYYFVKLPLPETDGEIQIKGLHAPVKVLRDRWGVPHIYAENQHDLFMAQGFVQAQDRLWQMESNRRLAAGRLSELIGPLTLGLDRLVRTLGVMRAARREVASYDASHLKILNAFAAGVNAFIDHKKGRLPLEFRLLNVVPEPWRPEDTLAWSKMMALFGGKNWQEEIVRAMLEQKLGADKTRELLSYNQHVPPTIIPSSLNLALLWPPRPHGPSAFVPVFGGASNNWTVHGSRTATGFPLLANDMHLPLRIPCVWYEMHLVAGDYDVIGLSLAGVPGIIAGHNRDLAWGITFGYTDGQDIFLERMNPHKAGQYLYKDQWLQAELIKEEIRVKGEKNPVIHEIWQTRHGPIISPQVPPTQSLEHALALKWSAHDPGDMMPTMSRINLARNWEEFKSAAQNWSEPAMNLVYADRKGNIGYVLASRIPIRMGGHGRGPFPGWTGENEWLGYVSPNQKPLLMNPARGFVATANNQVVSSDYPRYIAMDYATGFRAARIEQVLSDKAKTTKDDFRTLQGDFRCLPAAQFLATLEGIELQDPVSYQLLERLRSWDQVLGPDSVGGAIYSVLFYRLQENTFRDELGPVADHFFGAGLTYLEPLNRFCEHSRVILLRLMQDRESPWFDDIRTPNRENLIHVLDKSLKETAAFLQEKLGTDPSGWQWGRLHQVELQHALGSVKPLDRVFNLGPYEGGGHFSTVWQSAVNPGMDFDLKAWTVSHRHIYDLKDWDQSLGSVVPGQSGMFGSPHYDDQMEMWLKVEHHPLYYSREKVEAEAKHLLLLKP
ncbi:MAG: penicillin acylase family protein [Desulfobacteraceae bacterium]|nr:penicillin acylase family protein [Desulfobacteraceae bacterium]